MLAAGQFCPASKVENTHLKRLWNSHKNEQVNHSVRCHSRTNCPKLGFLGWQMAHLFICLAQTKQQGWGGLCSKAAENQQHRATLWWAPCGTFSMQGEREEGVCGGHGFICCFQYSASKCRKVVICTLDDVQNFGVSSLLLAFLL